MDPLTLQSVRSPALRDRPTDPLASSGKNSSPSKPRHLDLIKGTLNLEESVVEMSITNSPAGARMLTNPIRYVRATFTRADGHWWQVADVRCTASNNAVAWRSPTRIMRWAQTIDIPRR